MDINRIGVVILSVIVIGVSFAVYPMINSGVDDLSLYWTKSCLIDGERSTRVYAGALQTTVGENANNVYVTDERYFIGPGEAITFKDNKCEQALAIQDVNGVTPQVTIATKVYNERMQEVGNVLATTSTAAAALSPAGTEWNPPNTLNLFGELGPLVLSAIPIMVLASFVGMSVANIMTSDEGISDVTTTIVTLIVFIVVVRVLPVLLDFVVAADRATTDGYSVAQNFGAIQTLMFAAIPVLLVAGLIFFVGFLGYKKAKQMGVVG